MDALEKLIRLAERAYAESGEEEKPDPLAGLSPKEIRKRFDEFGEPREGFNVDGNPVTDTGEDSDEDPRVKGIRERTKRRRDRWD